MEIMKKIINYNIRFDNLYDAELVLNEILTFSRFVRLGRVSLDYLYRLMAITIDDSDLESIGWSHDEIEKAKIVRFRTGEYGFDIVEPHEIERVTDEDIELYHQMMFFTE